MTTKLTAGIKLTIAAAFVALCSVCVLAMSTPAYALSGNVPERDSYSVSIFQSEGGKISTDASVGEVIRFAGDTRYDTATAINEAIADINTYKGVIVCSGENGKFADALCAAGLSGMLDYPVVLVDGSASMLNTQTRETIDSLLGGRQGEIIVIGGTSTVSTQILRELREYDTDALVERFAGDDRYETACEAYNFEVNSGLWDGNQIIIAKGNDFPDALSAAAYCTTFGVPILLSDANLQNTEGYILSAARNADNALIVGGESSVSYDKESAISRYTSVERVNGYDRFGTSLSLVFWEISHGMNTETLGVATGTTFPDSLGSGGLLSIYNAPLLLVSDDTISDLCDYVSLVSTKRALIFGGENSVSSQVENLLQQTIYSNYSVSETYPGRTVTITATPDSGYMLDTIRVSTESGAGIATTQTATNTYTFTMPAAAVTVYATFEEIPEPGDYIVTLEQTTGGTIYAEGCIVTEDGTLTANEGDIITIVPVADDGWTLEAVRYQYYAYVQWAGKEITNTNAIEPIDGKFTFEMPAADVTFSPAWLLGDGDDGGNHTFEWVVDTTTTSLYTCRGCGQSFLTGVEITEHTKPYMLDPNNTHDVSTYTQAINGGYWRCSTCGIIYINLPD